MTYGQLLEQLSKLTPQQLNQSVTVYQADYFDYLVGDEYLPVNDIGVAVDDDIGVAVGDDVLDADQIVLNTGWTG